MEPLVEFRHRPEQGKRDGLGVRVVLSAEELPAELAVLAQCLAPQPTSLKAAAKIASERLPLYFGVFRFSRLLHL